MARASTVATLGHRVGRKRRGPEGPGAMEGAGAVEGAEPSVIDTMLSSLVAILQHTHAARECVAHPRYQPRAVRIVRRDTIQAADC